MDEQRRPKRSLRDIQELFITPQSERVGVSGLTHTVPSPVAASRKETPHPPRVLVLDLSLPDDHAGSFYFSLSLCRWLTASIPKVTLIAPRLAPDVWSSVADYFSLSPSATAPNAGSVQPFRLDEGLWLINADPFQIPVERSIPDRPGPPHAATGADPPRTAHQWDRAIVVNDARKSTPLSIQTVVWPDVQLTVLPARVEAFVDFYRMLKSVGNRRAERAYWVVLDRAGADFDPRRVERAWDEIGGRFLNTPIRILGQLDGGLFADADISVDHKLHLCSEHFGRSRSSDMLLSPRLSTHRRPTDHKSLIDWIEQCEERTTDGDA